MKILRGNVIVPLCRPRLQADPQRLHGCPYPAEPTGEKGGQSGEQEHCGERAGRGLQNPHSFCDEPLHRNPFSLQKVVEAKEADAALTDERASIGAPWGSVQEIEEALDDPANEQAMHRKRGSSSETSLIPLFS